MTDQAPSTTPPHASPKTPTPAEAGARFAALLAAAVSGFAVVVAGLLAGTPAPEILWRAVAVGAGVRVVAGWIGLAFAASLKTRASAKPPAANVEGAR